MLKGHWFCPVNRHGFEPANKGQVYFGRFYLGKRRLRQLRPHILSRHSFDGSVRARPATCLATKPAYLLRLSGRGQPHGGFSKTAKPSTCGFIFDNCGVVGGSRLNVVDGPVSWRGSRGRPEWSLIGGRRQRRPPAGRAPRAYSGIEGPRRPGRAPASAPRALVSAVATPRDSGARAPGKFF